LSAATLEAILCAVNALTADVRRLTAPPPADPGADTDASAAALRRLLCDLLDRRMESVLVGLAAARARLAALADSAAAVREIDALLDACGALRFEGDRLTVADPLIHSVVGYRCDLALPAGLILETTAPGFRTGHGLVLTKAAVIVNRRT
jgi:hypothetical protein